MRAELDDAPDWVQQRARKRGLGKPILIGLIGIGLTLGGLHIAGGAFLKNSLQKLTAVPSQPQPAPVAEVSRLQQAEKDWDQIVDEVAKRSGPTTTTVTTQNKQTTFHDGNYVPRGADSVVRYAPPTPEPEVPAPRKKLEVVVVGKPDPKLSDYCPGKEGSLQKRNCKTRTNLSERNR
jgi:hypothetical protein